MIRLCLAITTVPRVVTGERGTLSANDVRAVGEIYGLRSIVAIAMMACSGTVMYVPIVEGML